MSSALAVSDALQAAGAIGPWFQVEPWRHGQGWRRLDELLYDPCAMYERVDAATAKLTALSGQPLDDLHPRVVGSTVFLGLAARLVAPPLAATVLSGVLPSWSLADLWWRPTESGPWPLAVSASTGIVVGDLRDAHQVNRAAAQLNRTVVAGVVAPLLTRTHEQFALSEQVLWGNVASALAGALATLTGAVPARAGRAADLVGQMLRDGPLAGTGDLRPHPTQSRPSFVRRSCCLFYQVPGGGVCGDCLLAVRPR